ncbi:hypothetical protein A3Q56_07203 [Intoshia linei]|uniref:Kinesin-like protein n=1 Tax=Intoshia linei TaxID=1819745 RepID=A0A177AV54_9BILA|nr:hypothetical protein A3Q56_07203 [Intoshia linei]
MNIADENYKFNKQLIYNYTAKPFLNVLFNGGTATCFAYGQTGSGKTHTRNGKFNKKNQVFEEDGIYTYAAKDLFEWLKPRPQCAEFMTGGAYFKIYGGKVFDLLNNRNKLRILKVGRGCMQLLRLRETYLKNVDDAKNLIATGSRIRNSGQTSTNLNSSRSHAIFQFILLRKTSRKLYSVFSLIDLAGNERNADTISSDRQTQNIIGLNSGKLLGLIILNHPPANIKSKSHDNQPISVIEGDESITSELPNV